MSTENRTPAIPRDAASLLLYRHCSSGVEVLMGKRASGSRFMPDVYVYPGGAVDGPDAEAHPASPLDAACVPYLSVDGDERLAHALAMAAVRETFEEAGLAIAEAGDVGDVAHETWQLMRQQGLAPALSALRYLGRAITPAENPIRFHARFFSTDVAAIPSLADRAPEGNGELLDLRWVALAERDDLPMRGITRYMMDQLHHMLDAGPDWIGRTMYTQRDGKPCITRD